MAPARGAEAARPGEAHGVPRDHQRGDRGGHRQLARPRHEAGRGAGGSPHPRPAVRLRGLERRVPPHRPGHVGRAGAERRDPSRRRPRARPHGVPQRLVLGPRGRVRRRTSAGFPATLVTLDGKRLASGRDFDADTGRLERRTPTSRCSTRPARPRWPTRLAGPAVHGRLGRDPSSHRAAEGAVHHVDAAAGGGPQARLQLGAHDARRAGPLRARAHHLHADRLHLALRARRSARPATRSAACTATPTSPTSRASTAAR